MRRFKTSTLTPFFSAIMLVLIVHACKMPADSGGDQYHPPQTKILDVKVQPDTVAPGDTASFSCIIEDSTDKRFKFYWYIDAGEALDAVLYDEEPLVYQTELHRLQWVAPSQAGFHSFSVRANNGSKDSVSVKTSFVIIVQ